MAQRKNGDTTAMIYSLHMSFMLQKNMVLQGVFSKGHLKNALHDYRVLCIMKRFFRLIDNVLQMVLYITFLKNGLFFFEKHQKRYFYCYEAKLGTVEEPFLVLYRTLFKNVLYRTIYSTSTEEPFNEAKNPLIIFFIFFTKEPLKNHPF